MYELPRLAEMLQHQTGVLKNGMVYRVVYLKEHPITAIVHRFDLSVLCLSAVAVLITISVILHPEIKNRLSVRLSACMAIANLIEVIGELIIGYKANTSMPESTLRFLLWTRIFGLTAFVFAAASVALHIHISFILGKREISQKICRWCEVAIWPLAGIASHPFFYIYEAMVKHPTAKAVLYVDKSFYHMRLQCFLMYIVIFLSHFYCLVVCVLVALKLGCNWNQTELLIYLLPEGYKDLETGCCTITSHKF